MKLNILCDAHWESGLENISKELSSTGYRQAFASRDYGSDLNGIVIILMCRDPSLNFKQRIRLAKKEKILYLDIMLELDQMRQAKHEARKRIVAVRLAADVPAVLSKYQLANFDRIRFLEDFKSWLQQFEQN
jgi:hypothetical protein